MGNISDLFDEQEPAAPESAVTNVVPIKPMGSVSELYDEADDQDANRLGFLVEQETQTPERAARSLQIQQRTGIPKKFIDENFDELDKAAKAAEFNPKNFLKDSPLVSDWLIKNPDYIPLMRDDAGRLGTLETTLNSLRRGGQRFLQSKAATQASGIQSQIENLDVLQSLEAQGIDISPGKQKFEGFFSHDKRIERVPAEIRSLSAQERLAMRARLENRLVQSGTDIAEATVEIGKIAQDRQVAAAHSDGSLATWWHFFSENPVNYIVQVGTESVPQMAPGVVLAGAGLGPAGFGLGSYSQDLGNSLVDALREEGVDVTNKEAVQEALKNPQLMKRAYSQAAKHAGPVAVFDTLSAGIAGRVLAPARFASRPLVREATNLAVQAPVQGALGGAGEASGQLAQGKPLNPADIMAEVVGEFFTTPAEVAGMSISRGRARVREILEAKERQALFDALGNGIADSKSFQKLPEGVQKLVEDMTKDGPISEVRIPIEQWTTYWQSVGVDPAVMAAKVASAEAYQEAQGTGGDLVVSTAKYATQIAATPHGKGLSQDVRFQPGELTSREADALREEMKALATQEGKAEAVGQIQENVAQQLEAAGYKPEDASTNAMLHGLAGLQESGGEVAQKIVKQRYEMLNIERPLPEGLRKQAKAPILNVMLDRLRAGDVPREADVRGVSLVDWIVAQGGINDTTLTSKESQQFKSGLIKKSGKSLDEVALAAQRAGYLDTAGVQALIDAMTEELGGTPKYSGRPDSVMADLKSALEQVDEYLKQRGIDINALSNDEIQTLLKQTVKAESAEELQDQTVKEFFHGFNDALSRSVTDIVKDVYGLDSSFQAHKSRLMTRAEVVRQAIAPIAKEHGYSVILDPDAGGSHYFRFDRGGNDYFDVRVSDHNPGYKFDSDRDINVQMSGMDDDAARDAVEKIKKRIANAADHESQNILFQRQKDVKRGAIRFAEDRKFTIELFQKANLSTFAHESGHFFLEIFGEVSDAIRKIEKRTPDQDSIISDYDALLKWLGVESRADIKIDQHEKFARGFEAYLREGKAPSVELRSVFAKFRAWLVRLYKSIKNLDVAINDDIRGIMDRLLATEDEIEAANQEAEISETLTDAKSFGMTDIEFSAYRKTVEQANIEAKERLQQELMDEYYRANEKWWKEERTKTRGEVEKEVNQQRGYVAQSILTNGKLPDGSDLPEGMPAIKLDRETIEAAYGKETAKRITKTLSKDGMSTDAAAELLGYSSGEELVQEQSNLRPKNQLVEAETDLRMREKHGDMLLDGTVAAIAQDAVLGQGRTKVIEAEIKALRKKAREVTPFIKAERKAQAQDRRAGLSIISSSISLSALKEMAAGIMAQKRIRDISPKAYLMAVRKSAKLAIKLAGSGDYQGAFMEKQRELLNLELYRHATERLKKLDKQREYLGKFDRESTRKNLRGEFLVQLDELLARFDLRKRSLKAIDAEKEPLTDFITKESERLSAAVPDLPGYVLNESYRKNYKDMTVDEFDGLIDSVKQLEKLARRENEQYMAIRQMNFEQERGAVLDRLREFNKDSFDESGEPKSLEPDFVPTLSKAAKKLGDKFAGEFLNAETILNLLEGGEYGQVTQSLFGRMSDRSNWKATRLGSIYKKLKPLFDQYTLLERRAFSRDDIAQSIGMSLTRENAVVVALLYGNFEGRERLMNYGWSDAQLNAIIGLLGEKDMKLVNRIWLLFDEDLWPELKDLNDRTRGKAPPKVKALPYNTRHGEAIGGYFRLKYDTELDERAQHFDETQAVKDLLGGSMGMVAKTAQGTSQSRKKGVKMRPRLDLGVFSETVNETVHDLAYRESVADTMRMLNDDSIKTAVKRIAGTPAYRALVTRVREVAAPPRSPSGFIEKTLTIARKNTIVTLLSGARTALLNITGFSTTFSRVNNGLLLREIAKFFSPRMKEMYEFSMERSEYMRHRFNNFDRDLQDMAKKMTVDGGILPDTGTWLWIMAMTDRGVAVPTWNASFAEGMQKHENDVKMATEYADHIVRQTQGSGRDVDVAKIMSGHGGYGQLKRVFTMFYSYFNAQLAQLVRAGAVSAREAKTNRSLAVAKFTGRFMTIVVIPAVLSTIGGREDDDLTDENWFKKFTYAITMYGAGMFPIVRDLSSFVWAQFDKSVADYGLKLSPVQSAGEGTVKGMVSMRDILIGEGDEKDVKNIIMGTSYLVGLPGKQISDTVLGTNAFLEGEADPTAIIFGPPK